ncbi:MAG: S1 RNA-binding domain-containing protein, partial [Lachnospiraceae bacterium]|nr:S1 RNA-binding domain-containing protein [Lachnospiraceae bacterium]
MSEEKTMKDFEHDLDRSFKTLNEGDIMSVTVIGVSDTELTVDLNYYTDGIIPLAECSDDPMFSIKQDVKVGDVVKAMVTNPEDSQGHVRLSIRRATKVVIWDELKEDMEDGTVFEVKIQDDVPSGVITYVKGIRAFIPASQLALEYVEDTSKFIGKTVSAVIITADKEKQKLVLSASMIEKERALAEKTRKIGRLMIGDVVEGTIERMESYGVFINIGEGLTGLCHISQITNKFIKSPKEAVKLGETVKAQILKIDGERISLSIKALKEDEPEKEEETYEVPEEYRANKAEDHDESPFAALLKG